MDGSRKKKGLERRNLGKKQDKSWEAGKEGGTVGTKGGRMEGRKK
jgi:hypothetical protein